MNLQNIVRFSPIVITAMLLLIAAAIAQNGSPSTMNIPKPPATRAQPVTDNYFGQQVVDPYRWLEDGSSPETQQWVSGQLV
jgi:prolyl oligopeptidase